MEPSTAIIVFARAPQLGRVKTRLVPALGEQGALDLYRAMLRHALRIAHDCAANELILACTPDANDAELQAMGQAVGATLQDQRGADLGARMHDALHTALCRHRIALLIGSDCPSLRSEDLREARDRLVGYESGGDGSPRSSPATATEMVFIPATDGGYVLVGATKLCASIFQDMPWGGTQVMKLTRQRLGIAGREWSELKGRSDVDRTEDLALLSDEFRATVSLAPKF